MVTFEVISSGDANQSYKKDISRLSSLKFSNLEKRNELQPHFISQLTISSRRQKVQITQPSTIEEHIPCDRKEKCELDPQLVGLIHLKTLYKMDFNVWQIYDQKWEEFGERDKFKCPIPPNCKTLVLHLYLKTFQSSSDLLASYFQAKRRLQFCVFRIFDQRSFDAMKQDLEIGY